MAKYPVFFGTYSKGEGNGLLRGVFDDMTGGLVLQGAIDIENASYVQLSADEKTLYGVSETSSFEGQNGGALFAVSLEGEKMRLLSMTATHGASPCHLCVHDSFIYVSNYSEGSLSVCELSEGQGLTPCYQGIHHYGKGVNPARQEKPHIHFASMTPNGAYLALCDLGLDQVVFYPYSKEQGLSTKARRLACPAGSGPRHLTFSADGRYLYVLTELKNTVLAYAYHDGNAQLIQEISTLPADFTGKSTAAAIHISPDGKCLAASNRGHDSIVRFSVLGNGSLLPMGFLRTGREPRDFRFTPNGAWILSANQESNSVTVYNTNLGEGAELVGSCAMPRPVCILFGSSYEL